MIRNKNQKPQNHNRKIYDQFLHIMANWLYVAKPHSHCTISLVRHRRNKQLNTQHYSESSSNEPETYHYLNYFLY